jgi:hypothetical protein
VSGFTNLEPPPERHRIVISRYWNHPRITVTVNHERIELYASVDDFAKAVLDEMGPSWKLFTKARMQRKMMESVKAVIEKVKEASAQVM